MEVQEWLKEPKSQGQIAYEEDVRRAPRYHDGTLRKPWKQLCNVAQWSWICNPIPRTYN